MCDCWVKISLMKILNKIAFFMLLLDVTKMIRLRGTFFMFVER